MKKYILIAGVNGAGKSTLYQVSQNLKNIPRVNTDEILREFGDWKKPADIIKAGKIAVRMIEKYFEEGITFNQETTLCGNSILKNIKKAKALGYVVELHYVGVNTVEIAKERVRIRVQKGGHGIREEDIEKRYIETFKNLERILPECNLIAFYDNTIKFRRIGIFRNGYPVRISHNIPGWFQKNVLQNI